MQHIVHTWCLKFHMTAEFRFQKVNSNFRSLRRMDVSNADKERIRKEMNESSRRMDISNADIDRIRREMARSSEQIKVM